MTCLSTIQYCYSEGVVAIFDENEEFLYVLVKAGCSCAFDIRLYFIDGHFQKTKEDSEGEEVGIPFGTDNAKAIINSHKVEAITSSALLTRDDDPSVSYFIPHSGYAHWAEDGDKSTYVGHGWTGYFFTDTSEVDGWEPPFFMHQKGGRRTALTTGKYCFKDEELTESCVCDTPDCPASAISFSVSTLTSVRGNFVNVCDRLQV